MDDQRSAINALEPLSEEDSKRLSMKLDDLQIRDSLKLYNVMVERCFSDCVHSFLRKNLNKEEDACVRRCTDKFTRLVMRTGLSVTDLGPDKATQAQL